LDGSAVAGAMGHPRFLAEAGVVAQEEWAKYPAAFGADPRFREAALLAVRIDQQA
jgi:hypothetical protein